MNREDFKLEIKTHTLNPFRVEEVKGINCLSTYIDDERNKLISKNQGQSKEELKDGEPFAEILARNAKEQDLTQFGLTKQDVERMHENRIKKTHNKDTRQDIRE